MKSILEYYECPVCGAKGKIKSMEYGYYESDVLVDGQDELEYAPMTCAGSDVQVFRCSVCKEEVTAMIPFHCPECEDVHEKGSPCCCSLESLHSYLEALKKCEEGVSDAEKD